MTFESLEEAVAELRKHPGKPVQAYCGELAVELRAIPAAKASPLQLGDALASLGPWGGESSEELMSRLREARASGGSGALPKL